MRTTESPDAGNEPVVYPGTPAGEPQQGPGIEPGTPADDEDLDDTPALPMRIPDWIRQSLGREAWDQSFR